MSQKPLSDAEPVDDAPDQLWPMGAVTRRTGIGEHTLRAWERRFGFPEPQRLPSGHRRFTTDQVQQLLLVNAALGLGYRAGDVVPLSRRQIEDLLREHGTLESPLAEPTPAEWTPGVLDACRRFDRDGLMAILQHESANLGVPRFVRERAAPMLEELGQAWARGDIHVRHEHFFSEILEDHLRALRVSLERSGRGRPVVLAALPDEMHALGLQIAALMLASHDRSVRILGPHMPVDEIVAAAVSMDAIAVGLSISSHQVDDRVAGLVAEVRDLLPDTIRLWLGGGGAGELVKVPPACDLVVTIDELEREVDALGE